MRMHDSTRGRIIQSGTWLLGLLFVVAAGLKALEFGAFVQQIGRYNLIPQSLNTSAGVGIILAEAALGTCCMVGFQAGKALWGMCALLALFIAATAARWGSLAGANCGCFGSVSAGGPGAVLLHGSVLLAIAGGLALLGRGTAGQTSFRGFRGATGIMAAVLIMFAVQPSATSVPGAEPRAEELRVFMSATCGKCMGEAGKVKELGGDPAVLPVRVFIGADFKSQVEEFFKKAGVELEYTPLTFPQLAREAHQVPSVQLFHGGKLLHEWVGRVPSPQEVKELLAPGTAFTNDGQKQTPAGRL